MTFNKSYNIFTKYLSNIIFPIEYDILLIISKYTILPSIDADVLYVSYHTKCSNIDALVYLSQSYGDRIYTVKKVLNKHL